VVLHSSVKIATSAVEDDAGQDQCHARHPHEMSEMSGLGAVRGMAPAGHNTQQVQQKAGEENRNAKSRE
jgi:hypothetical protein